MLLNSVLVIRMCRLSINGFHCLDWVSGDLLHDRAAACIARHGSAGELTALQSFYENEQRPADINNGLQTLHVASGCGFNATQSSVSYRNSTS